MVHVCQKQDLFTYRDMSWLQGHQCHSNVSHRESWPRATIDCVGSPNKDHFVVSAGAVYHRKLFFVHPSFLTEAKAQPRLFV